MTRELYAYPNRSPKARFDWSLVDERLREGTAWAYRDEERSRHSDAYLLVQRDQALRNYDLSMAYFKSLDPDEFEAALQHVLVKGRTFKSVESLPKWDYVEGAYIMVFDDYKQFYIGQSSDIRKRIRRHWTSRKPFDRVVYGSVYDSIFPADELRAQDTTRIYGAKSVNPFALEERAEKAADQRFCLNRMGGGNSPVTQMLSALSPRKRSNDVVALPSGREDYEQAWDGVKDVIGDARMTPDVSVVSELASLDLGIYSVERQDRPIFMWSRRDMIAEAAKRGDLSTEEFAAFLEAMGETIIWPED